MGCLLVLQGTFNTNGQKSELRGLFHMVIGQLKIHHATWSRYLYAFEPELNTNTAAGEDTAMPDTSDARSVRNRKKTEKYGR